MAQTAKHDADMENLMGTEFRESFIEYLQLHGVNDAADGINNSADGQKQKGLQRKADIQLRHDKNADPAHSDINDRRKPFRTGHPKQLEYHSDKSQPPGRSQQVGSGWL